MTGASIEHISMQNPVLIQILRDQLPGHTLDGRKWGSGISPIELSPLAKVHRTIANISPGISPIGETPLYFRQYFSRNFANTSFGISPIGESILNFRQF
jgi:hypothetical protein